MSPKPEMSEASAERDINFVGGRYATFAVASLQPSLRSSSNLTLHLSPSNCERERSRGKRE